MIDKVTIVPIILYFCVKNDLFLPFGIALLVIEIFGTINRQPFINRFPFKFLAKYNRQSSATSLGKIKFILECITVLLYMAGCLS